MRIAPEYADRNPSVAARLADALFLGRLPPGVEAEQIQQIRRVGPDRFEVFYQTPTGGQYRYISDGLPELLEHPAGVVSPP